MEGVGKRVGQMMGTEADWGPEEDKPKRKAVSMEDLRKKYPWWPSSNVTKGSVALIEMEPLDGEGTVARGIKSTKL